MIPEAYRNDVPADFRPDAEAIKRMRDYNEELGKAGILLALDGLHPAANGARITYKGGKPSVKDGPFTEVKEVLGGFWIIDVRSRDEAIEWARRIPAAEGDIVEVRQVFDDSDFSEDVLKAAGAL